IVLRSIRSAAAISVLRTTRSWPIAEIGFLERPAVAGTGWPAGKAAAHSAAGTIHGQLAFEWICVFPHDFLFRRHFKDPALLAGANQRVAVGQSLGAGNMARKEIGFLLAGIAPLGLRRAKLALATLRINSI